MVQALATRRSLARGLDGAGAVAVRPPLEDLGLPALGPGRLLLLATCAAAAAAFVRDRAEHATVTQALGTAGIEAAAVVAGFLLLGRTLGLWHPGR